MTEGWKSLRARFEKLNENQDGKTQLNSLQSQNPSKLGVFLYRNRNEQIFSNEEELNSLERSYQAILKETGDPSLKSKSPIQNLDRISKKYSKLRSQAELKLQTGTIPQIHIKRFKADHGSCFYSYTAIYPVIEEPVIIDEPEQTTLPSPEKPIEASVYQQEPTPKDLTPEEIDDDFYEEYEEYEEHLIVSTSPLDVHKTTIEPIPESQATIEENTSELPSTITLPSSELATPIAEDPAIEYEEDYMESFDEYDIEEAHVVDITPLTPMREEDVFDKPETSTIAIPTEETNPVAENATKEQTIEEAHHVVNVVEVPPIIEEKQPQQTEPVFVEKQPEQLKEIKPLEFVERVEKKETIEKEEVEPISIPDVTPSQSEKLEKSIEYQTTRTTSSNVHESNETKIVSIKEEPKVQDTKPMEPVLLEEREQTPVKSLPVVLKEKLAPVLVTEPKSSKSVAAEALKVEIPKPISPNLTALVSEQKEESSFEVAKVEQVAEEKQEMVKPLIKELPKPTPSVDSPKPLPVVPKKPVKALPVVSPKVLEETKSLFEPVSPFSKPTSESNEPTTPQPTTPLSENKTEAVVESPKISEPTLSRTASIRSYFSSFLSKTPRKMESKVPPIEINEVEKQAAKLVKEEIVETKLDDLSAKESESSMDDDPSEHSTINIEDFLSEGGDDVKTDIPNNTQFEDTPKEEDIKEESSGIDTLASVLENSSEKTKEGRKVSTSSTNDSPGSIGERSDSRKSKRANRRKSTRDSPHQEAGTLLLQDYLDSNPSSRSNSATTKQSVKDVEEVEVVEHLALEDFIGEDSALLSTISETTTSCTHPSPSRSDSTHNETTPLVNTPKSLLDLYSPITPKRKEKLFENFVDPSTFPKGWEKPYTFLYTEKPLMEHPLLDKLRRNIIDLLTSSMNEEARVSGIVNINRTSPLLAPLVHSIYSILINRTKPTIFKSDRDLCTIFSKLEIVKKEKIVQDFLAFKEVRILDPKKLKERDLLFIQYLLQSKLLAVCTYELALNQKYTAVCFEETSIMNLQEYSPTIFAVLNLLKKHFNFELKFEFELSQQAGGSKEEGTIISTLQGNIKTLLQYIIEIGKNEKIPINAITDESKNHNIGKVVRSLVMYILKSVLMDKLISESKWKNIAGTLISHPWHLITACAKGELSKVGMIVKTGYSFDSIVLTIDSTVKKKNQTTKQQLLDDKFFSFVAYCLNYQILTDALKFIFKNIVILEKNYRPDSIMCDPVQQDQILTILKPLSKLRFTLNFY